MTNRHPPVEVTDTTPIIHRVLVPGEVFYVYGYLGRSKELPDVPMMWLDRKLVAILPMSCVVERWTRGEPFHRDWSIVWSPPAGIDVDWLRDHRDWRAA